jgi:hypothetical protein
MRGAPQDSRRTDLDWLRIAAFGLLILYHVGVFYAPGPSAVGAWSPRVLPWLIVPMLALNPWRLLLLFIVSGCATRFMADKMSVASLFRSRSTRLLIPLVFGMAVIVPPQAYVQVVERYGFTGDYLAFLGRYFTAYRGFCREGACMILPTYNHLWFVAYLWNYTTLLVVALAAAPKLVAVAEHGLERLLRGPGIFIWPLAWLALSRFLLANRFPNIGDPRTDWYSHATYLAGFLFGFLVLRLPSIWTRIEAMRQVWLGGALGAWATMIGLGIALLGSDFDWSPVRSAGVSGAHASTLAQAAAALLWGADQWLWILAAFGYAHRYLRGRDGPARRYLTEAVFPFYIIHQTTIEVVGHYLARDRLALPLEATLLIGATAASCWLGYEVVRRVKWLRPLFGLKTAPPAPVVAARASPLEPWPDTQ